MPPRSFHNRGSGWRIEPQPWFTEEGPVDTNVPNTGNQTTFAIGTQDVSGNGNHLCAWGTGGTGTLFRGDTPLGNVPLNGLVNGLSAENEGEFSGMFTWSEQGSPTGVDIEDHVFTEWTIEAFFKLTVNAGGNGGYGNKTLIGRDGRFGGANGDYSQLYLQLYDTNAVPGRLRLQYNDMAGNTHMLISDWDDIYE